MPTMSKEYQMAWRAKRKAAGLPYRGGKMPRAWHQEYESKYRQRPEVKSRLNQRAKQRRKNPLERAKHLARWALNHAIETGRIIRQPCEVCGGKGQGHHDDYSKPLDVKRLCAIHHTEFHANAEKEAK